MESNERIAAGYPPGKDNGFSAKERGQTTRNHIEDLIVIPERVVEGLVRDSAGQPVTTPADKTHIYVVGDCGKIYIALEHEKDRTIPGAVKHDTLLEGKPTWGAGEIRFHNGKVAAVNVISGTYQPPKEIQIFVEELLRRAGV